MITALKVPRSTNYTRLQPHTASTFPSTNIQIRSFEQFKTLKLHLPCPRENARASHARQISPRQCNASTLAEWYHSALIAQQTGKQIQTHDENEFYTYNYRFHSGFARPTCLTTNANENRLGLVESALSGNPLTPPSKNRSNSILFEPAPSPSLYNKVKISNCKTQGRNKKTKQLYTSIFSKLLGASFYRE